MKWHMCVLIRILKWKTNSLYTGEGASQIFIIQTVLSLQNVRSNNNFEMKNEYQLVSIYRGRGFSNFHYTDILIFTKGIPTPGKTVWILKMGPIRLIVCWKARRNTNVYIYMLTNSILTILTSILRTKNINSKQEQDICGTPRVQKDYI